MLGDYFKFTVKSIISKKIRSWLTIFGIIIGVAAIVALVSVSQGMDNAIREQFEKLGVRSIRVFPSELRGPPTGDLGFNEDIISKVEQVKGVDYVNPVLVEFGDIKYNNQETAILIHGYDTDIGEKGFLDTDVDVEEGRFFNVGEKGSVIVGWDLAKDTFDKEIPVRSSIVVEGVKLKVIGIFEDTGTDLDSRIYMSIPTFRSIFGESDIVNALTVQLLPGVDIETARDAIQRKLERTLDEEDFDVQTPDQLLRQFSQILGIVQAVLVAIASIALLVGGIGIMNSMFTAVLERTREIGVMKAVGARNGDILILFLLESGITGFVGGLLGAIGGSLFAHSVGIGASLAGYPILKIETEYGIIIISLLFAFVIGIVSGILPAMRAAKLQPVDALRYE